MRSSSPVRAPRLKVAAEQSSTAECWIGMKNIPHVQEQRRSHNDFRRGKLAFRIKFLTVIQAYAPTSNAKEAEIEWFYDDMQKKEMEIPLEYSCLENPAD